MSRFSVDTGLNARTLRGGGSAASRTLTRLMLALGITVFALGLPVGPARPALAATSLSVPAAADAWLNKSKPNNNYGKATALRAQVGESETLLKFNVSAWSGKRIATLSLSVGGVGGNASGLVVDRTASGWKESTVNWNLRPKTIATIATVSGLPLAAGAPAQFDVKSAFPTGTVDRSTVWLRVRSSSASLVTFGSRESTSKPTLTLTPAEPVPPTQAKAMSDTWVESAAPARTHGGATYLLVDGQARTEAYLKFDVSAWQNRRFSSVKLRLRVRTAGGSGVSITSVGSSWSESTLSWKTRPAVISSLATLPSAPATGVLDVDLTSAFPGGLIATDRFAIRVATTNSRGFDFSSREGPNPPLLIVVPEAAVIPSPTPIATPTPTPSITPSPTVIVTPSPTPTATSTPTPTVQPSASVCPTPTPTSTPTPTATPTPMPSSDPTPTPEPEPLFYFLGHGTDHGVGMSQWGAKGRALDGQTYDQILNFYYTGVDFSTIDGSQPIRVRLSNAFWPTATKPARVTGYIGGWQSNSFPGMAFPQGSYVQLAPNLPPPDPTPTPDPCGNVPAPTPTPTPPDATLITWTATAYDATGVVLATTVTNDLTVTATDPEGVLRMAHRDEQVGYTTYRGSMRMVVMATGLQTINILPLETYLRGVVPAESPASWPIEAVKAQAVAARTYALQRIRTTFNWDVLPDSANQNYGGWQHERARSDAAILATANKVLTYEGAVISAVYHSASGGYTENSEYSFTNSSGDPGNIIPYLRGKPDVDENGVPYDINASSYDWQTAQFTMSQLSQIFGRNSQTDVGEITNIEYLRGVSGRVYRVVLTGTEGTKQVSGGRFKNIYSDNKLSGAKMLSAMFYLTPVDPPVDPSLSPTPTPPAP